MLSEVIRSTRYLNLSLDITALELNLMARNTESCRAMRVDLTCGVVRVKFATTPRREATLRSVNLFRELPHAVNRILKRFLYLLSGILGIWILC